MDALIEQFWWFTIANESAIPPPPLHPPNLPPYSSQRLIPHRFQQQQTPIHRQGMNFAYGPHRGEPRAPHQHCMVPLIVCDPTSFRDELPAYGTDGYD